MALRDQTTQFRRKMQTYWKAENPMKSVRAGIFEFLIFAAIVAILLAAHSSRLDKALIVVCAVLLIGGSARLIYKGFSARNDPAAVNRTVTGRWSSILPAKLARWMHCETGAGRQQK
jgi:hypothetical protein